MTKTLSILKVFFRLKHEELKKAYFYRWFPISLSVFIFPLFFYKADWVIVGYPPTTAKHYWMCVTWVLMFYCGLILLFNIIIVIIQLFKWIRSNWRKAKKEVEEK